MTEPVNFNDEPDLPPSILSKPGEFEIGTMLWIKKSRTSEWDMGVQVRDENIRQELVAHWRIVHMENMQPVFGSTTVPIGDSAVRDFVFKVRSDDLRELRCHVLQLAISGSFFRHENQPQFFDLVPEGRESDVAKVSWTILEGDPDEASELEKAAILDSCISVRTLLDATAEPMSTEESR